MSKIKKVYMTFLDLGIDGICFTKIFSNKDSAKNYIKEKSNEFPEYELSFNGEKARDSYGNEYVIKEMELFE